jgi:hypothetical protein
LELIIYVCATDSKGKSEHVWRYRQGASFRTALRWPGAAGEANKQMFCISCIFSLSFFLLICFSLKKNPFAPEVPCHRVVAASLAIGGFKGTSEELYMRLPWAVDFMAVDVHDMEHHVCVSLFLIRIGGRGLGPYL